MNHRSSHEIDMIHGSILPKLLIFALPLAGSGILQVMFNAADVVVLGRYVGSTALAAVGSTGSLTSLIIDLFLGMSVGVNVVVSNTYAAEKYDEVSDAVHTAVALSLLLGVMLLAVGIFLINPLLHLMEFPKEVLPLSRQYLMIYFCGVPFIMLYNFGSAIMRSVGDTKRALVFLVIAGVINVILNLFFVIVCHLGVAGVAIATTASNAVSASLVVGALLKEDSCLHLDLRKLRIKRTTALKIAKIGIPAGLGSICFAVSNVVFQSSINSLGAVTMAGNSAAMNLEGFYYVAMHSVEEASITFTGQNYGARKYSRINKVLLNAAVGIIMVVAVFCPLFYFGGPKLLSFYNSDPEVINAGMVRMRIFSYSYLFCGLMNITSGAIRGLGYGLPPTLMMILGVVGFRIIWVMTAFHSTGSLEVLLYGYTISWIITIIGLLIIYRIVRSRLPKKDA